MSVPDLLRLKPRCIDGYPAVAPIPERGGVTCYSTVEKFLDCTGVTKLERDPLVLADKLPKMPMKPSLRQRES